MADIKQYNADLRTEKAKLDRDYPSGFLFITSVKNRHVGSTDGAVTEVDTKTAARHLLENSARPSTPDEISAFKRQGQMNSLQMAHGELKSGLDRGGFYGHILTPGGKK